LVMWRFVVALALGGLIACAKANYSSAGLRCAASADCAAGLVCLQNVCVAPGTEWTGEAPRAEDAGAVADSGSDDIGRDSGAVVDAAPRQDSGGGVDAGGFDAGRPGANRCISVHNGKGLRTWLNLGDDADFVTEFWVHIAPSVSIQSAPRVSYLLLASPSIDDPNGGHESNPDAIQFALQLQDDGRVKYLLNWNGAAQPVDQYIIDRPSAEDPWVHIAIDYDHGTTTRRFFVNGTRAAQLQSASLPVNGLRALFIAGARTPEFNGLPGAIIRSLRIGTASRFNRSFTPDRSFSERLDDHLLWPGFSGDCTVSAASETTACFTQGEAEVIDCPG
jgi:hypothetical protein